MSYNRIRPRRDIGGGRHEAASTFGAPEFERKSQKRVARICCIEATEKPRKMGRGGASAVISILHMSGV